MTCVVVAIISFLVGVGVALELFVAMLKSGKLDDLVDDLRAVRK